MSGGRGTRLDAPVEKPLFEVGGTPMVDRVLAALGGSQVGEIHAVVSPHVPATRRHLSERPVGIVDAPGDGYVADLSHALERDGVESPILTVAADLPLLDGPAVDRVLAAHEGGSLTACVPVARKRELGVSADTTFERECRELAPTGVNVVAEGDADTVHVTCDARLAVNVNRQSDAAIAEELL